jgi:hypothetical protein
MKASLFGLRRIEADEAHPVATGQSTDRRRHFKRGTGNDLPAPQSIAAWQAGATKPTMQEPIKGPAQFPWQEVTKVANYWLEVNAMTRPMMVREGTPPYGGKRP